MEVKIFNGAGVWVGVVWVLFGEIRGLEVSVWKGRRGGMILEGE